MSQGGFYYIFANTKTDAYDIPVNCKMFLLCFGLLFFICTYCFYGISSFPGEKMAPPEGLPEGLREGRMLVGLPAGSFNMCALFIFGVFDFHIFLCRVHSCWICVGRNASRNGPLCDFSLSCQHFDCHCEAALPLVCRNWRLLVGVHDNGAGHYGDCSPFRPGRSFKGSGVTEECPAAEQGWDGAFLADNPCDDSPYDTVLVCGAGR